MASPDNRSTHEQISGRNPSRLSLTAKCRCRASANEIDDGPAVHHACKVKRVPIGEADATVRFSLADFFRRGRAVDAVTRHREIDPDQADRILRPRLDGKFVLSFDALEAKAWVVVIGRVMRHA